MVSLLPIPSIFCISRTGVPISYSFTQLSSLAFVEALTADFRPNLTPFSLAAFLPSAVRSKIKSDLTSL